VADPKIIANPEPGVLVRLEFEDGSACDITAQVEGRRGGRTSLAFEWGRVMHDDRITHERLGDAMAEVLRRG
jgi:hypothetical protein